MSLIDRIAAARTALAVRAPSGVDVAVWESESGHMDEWSPPEYGDYIATSNEVYAAILLRARRMATVPLVAYTGSDENRQRRPDDRVARLLAYVNPFWTFNRLMRMTEICMGLYGESFWAVQKDSLGVPVELWWMDPRRVRPIPHPERYLSGFVYEPVSGGKPILFGADEVVWFRYPNPLDEYAGLSPLVAARLAADFASASMKANKRMHDQGLSIAGIVHPATGKVSFSPEQASDLEQQLQRRMSGADKAHRWAVLRFEAAFTPMNVTAKDAQFVEGMNLSVRQVARAYTVPSPLLMDLENATLANLQQFLIMLWELGLVPDLMDYAAELREQLLPMFPRGTTRVDHLEHDFSGVSVLQESASASWDRERQQIEVGALMINEWRVKHGMPKVPWGDTYWAPVNKQPLDASVAPATNDGGTDVEPVTQAGLADLSRLLRDELDGLAADLAGLKTAERVRDIVRGDQGEIVRVVERMVGSNGAR